MLKCIYVPFNQDVHAEAIKQIVDGCCLIFPTHPSKSRAIQSFLPQWKLERISWFTIQEFVNWLIVPPKPALTDEKRLLCLWQVLEKEDKDTFHLESYDDLVDWGNSFFAFFGEMRDEQVPLTALQNNPDLNTREWQDEHIGRILAILERYESFICEKGFTDAVFYLDMDNLIRLDEPRKLVFVNQYYYSKLEKELIRRLDEAGFEIVILHQGIPDSFDVEKLEAKPLDLTQIPEEQIALQELSVVHCRSLAEMSVSCLSDYGSQKEALLAEKESLRRVLIDSGMQQSGYSRLFDPVRFGFSSNISLTKTQLFSLLKLYESHLAALAQYEGKGYLLLSEVAKALATPGFVQIYNQKDRQKLLDQLRVLAKDSVLYIDLELKVFELGLFQGEDQPGLYYLLRDHFAILKALQQIRSVGDLAAVFESENGLTLAKLCSQAEYESTDIVLVFYDLLSNFQSVEELGIVGDWERIFPAAGNSLAQKIFKLWLDYLAAGRIGPKLKKERTLYQVSNLLDSRNIRYDEVLVFNCMEGILPQNPEPVWLLNQAQKLKIGLKNYDTIRAWERYYFLRLILGSAKTTLYCYSEQENDLEPSSYLNELMQHLNPERVEPRLRKQVRLNYIQPNIDPALLSQAQSLVYQGETVHQLLQQSGQYDFSPSPGEDFFVLPYDEQDFGEELRFNSYSLSSFTSNPFAWYITKHRRIEPVELLPQETLSPLLFGNITHEFMGTILGKVAGKNQGLGPLDAVFSNEKALKDELIESLKLAAWDFKMPQNYNRDFLFEVIADCLVDSVQQFYYRWLEPNLKNTAFELLPEDSELRPEKIELTHLGEDFRFSVVLSGRADLRIRSSAKDYIIDFKTGSADVDQLIFYEHYYYDFYKYPDPFEDDEIHSLFWMVLEGKAEKEGAKIDRWEDWRYKIGDALSECISSGYHTGNSQTDKQKSQAITRVDLKKAIKKQQEES